MAISPFLLNCVYTLISVAIAATNTIGIAIEDLDTRTTDMTISCNICLIIIFSLSIKKTKTHKIPIVRGIDEPKYIAELNCQ